MVVSSGNGIHIVDQFNCLHCLRCIHLCPRHVISFGELTHGPQRYKGKNRKTLYAKSCNGEGEFFEKDLKKLTSKWRWNTIRYWLKHREKNWKKITTQMMEEEA